MPVSPIQEIIADIRAGKMVILVDDEARENEGDLVLGAEFVSADAINFMARYGRGLICLTLTEERCRQLRNVAPDSVRYARRAWAGRSLTMWRDDGRGLRRFTLEVPIEEGELISRALDCAVAAGEVTRDVDPTRFEPNEIDPADFDPTAVAESKGTSWSAQQADVSGCRASEGPTPRSSPYVVASPKVKNVSHATPCGSATHALSDLA